MAKKIFILLFEIGFGITFNIIGTISISEIFLLFYFFVIIHNRNLFQDYPILKKITWLYVGLLASQIISEIIVRNSFNNASRGVMITVVSYLHLMFLFTFFIKDKKYILYALAGLAIRYLLFSELDQSDVTAALTGEDSGVLKFYLVNIIVSPLLILSVIISKKRIMAIIAIIVGLSLIILGARNAGLTLILTGMISYFVLSGRTINRKIMIRIAVLGIIFGYLFYFFYINQVLTGKITAGNNEQIEQISNPYNPISLLQLGRPDSFVGWQAFMDNFWFGHGSWAADITGKYNRLLISMQDVKNIKNVDVSLIPTHSVLISAGTYNGIFAFLFMFSILYFFIKRGIQSVNQNDAYLIIVVYCIFDILWNGLFSPASHFRLTLPLSFAILLTSYLTNYSAERKETP